MDDYPLKTVDQLYVQNPLVLSLATILLGSSEGATGATKLDELLDFIAANLPISDEIQAKFDEILGGAPEALNAFNELAAALGNDEDFAATVTASIADKLAKAQNLSDLPDKVTARANLSLAWEKIYDGAYSTQSAFVVTDLGAYRAIRVAGRIFTSSDTGIYTQVSTDNGATWAASPGDYESNYFGAQGAGSSAALNTETSSVPLTNGAAVSSNPDLATLIDLLMEPFNGGAYLRFKAESGSWEAGGGYITITNGRRNSNTARNAFRIIAASGTISGALVVEGVR